MIRRTICTLLLATTALNAQEPAYPRYSLFNTQIRFLHSEEVGRTFKLFVNLPRGYAEAPERDWPVLYLTDPGAHFAMVTDMQRLLEDTGDIDAAIAVGIGYESVVRDTLRKYRTLDLTPPGGREGTGGAPEFLRFIETELVPFIQAEYRANPQARAFWGGSLGGLFGTYALLFSPRLFHRVCVNSPVPGWGDGLLFRRIEALAQRRDDLSAKVYIAVGGAESEEWMVEPSRRLAAALNDSGLRGLEAELDLVSGETHGSIAPIGINRCLCRMFARVHDGEE